jgi:hypothetical protein
MTLYEIKYTLVYCTSKEKNTLRSKYLYIQTHKHTHIYIVTCLVTTDGVLIVNWIYWTLVDCN